MSTKGKSGKQIDFKSIVSVADKTEEGKSTSQSKTQECPWMFGFELKCKNRTYELHAPNRKDLNHWLRLFTLVIQMSRERTTLGPLAFEAQ